MNKEEQLARLLRLKRHETPGEDYFEGFLEEFHGYQRKTLATQSAFSLWRERVGTALSVLRRPATAWAAAGVYAAAMVLIHAWPAPDHGAKTTIVISDPARATPAPAPSPAPGTPLPGWQTSIPAGHTMTVSDSPSLVPPPPGKRRTTEQPADSRNIIGPGTEEIQTPSQKNP